MRNSNQTASGITTRVSQSVIWRSIASVVLFMALGWFTVTYAASDAPVALSAGGRIDCSSIEAASVTPDLTVLPQASQAFSVTVLDTNDTWGYIDPCG